MRYFRGRDWQEFEELPDDAVLLVRSVGLKHVDMTSQALREYAIPYFTAAEYKDNVQFYVQKERLNEVEKLVKEYFAKKQTNS